MVQKHFTERDDITIIPISDVHLGASEHMQTEWINFINQIKIRSQNYSASDFLLSLFLGRQTIVPS